MALRNMASEHGGMGWGWVWETLEGFSNLRDLNFECSCMSSVTSGNIAEAVL